jgi:ubiquinone biosynthesis monooxygenase Coq7
VGFVVPGLICGECQHRDEALSRGAETAPAYPLLAGAIRLSCRIAIALSEKL